MGKGQLDLLIISLPLDLGVIAFVFYSNFCTLFFLTFKTRKYD